MLEPLHCPRGPLTQVHPTDGAHRTQACPTPSVSFRASTWRARGPCALSSLLFWQQTCQVTGPLGPPPAAAPHTAQACPGLTTGPWEEAAFSCRCPSLGRDDHELQAALRGRGAPAGRRACHGVTPAPARAAPALGQHCGHSLSFFAEPLS